MSRRVSFLVAGWVLVSTAPLLAQDAVLGQIYGSGVHAYFAQDYLRSYQLFTSAIDGHSQDPRCYYFRGLALVKLGRPQDAEIDFQHGAKLESATDPVRSFDVARSLERVQGGERSTLERYRLEARMAVLQKAEQERTTRYQEGLKEQRAALQKASEGAPPATVETPVPGEVVKPIEVPGEVTKPAGVVSPTSPPANPFSTGDEGKPAEMKKDGGAKPDAGTPLPDATLTPTVPAAGAKPDAAKPDAAKPDAGNPFGDSAAKPDAPPAAAAKPDAAKPDAAKPDTSNPFAEEPPAAAGAKPAAKPDAAPADAAKPADDKKPADATKPADAKKPADDNPFGN